MSLVEVAKGFDHAGNEETGDGVVEGCPVAAVDDSPQVAAQIRVGQQEDELVI